MMNYFEQKEAEIKNMRKVKRVLTKRKDEVEALWMEFILQAWAVYEDYNANVDTYYNPLTSWDLSDLKVASIYGDKVYLSNPSIGYKVPYEMIADKVNSVISNTDVGFTITAERKIGGFIFQVSDYICSELPEEEKSLLEVLGKIDRQVTPVSVTESIFCPSGI